MGFGTIAQFALATALPAVACAALALLRQKTGVSKLPERAWQVVVGIVFGIIAICGTEAGIPVDGAMMNVRDAAPLAAGLFFGGPAGIIAGIIGGVERWLAVMWGVGEFTRVACSLGTIFAGFYAALLRKFMFERHIPNLGMSFATGVVIEVLHLTLVIVTNTGDLARALQVAQACSLPMTLCVGLATLLSSLTMTLVGHGTLITPVPQRNVARILHTRMLVGVIAMFLITLGFTIAVQTGLSRTETQNLLELGIQDVDNDIRDASDANLLALTRRVAQSLPVAADATSEQCTRLAAELDVAEINVIGPDGIITASTFPAFLGFDMASGEQSAAFLVLLPGGQSTELVQEYQPIAYDSTAWRKYAGATVEGGFVQVGYDSSSFLDDLASHVQASVKNRHVGQTGSFVAIDETGAAIGTHDQLAAEDVAQLAADADKVAPNTLFRTSLAGQDSFAAYREVEGYRIIALMPTSEANASRNRSVLIVAFMEVLVFAALFIIIYGVIKHVVVRGVRRMTRQLGQITNGDLNVEVDVHDTSEFASLSKDINLTVNALKTSMAAIQTDLDMAAQIQANTLPSITKVITGRSEFELFASMEPAKDVGGDFYDFFMIDEDHLALVVADVSGKGIPAALFMMLSKTVIKMEALSGMPPEKVLAKANADLSEKNDDDMFTTAWLGVLEISTGTLVYADAGHEKLALSHGGIWELPPKPNGAVALGSFEQADYEELPERYHFRIHTVQLQPGDAIFQYTDGVTEATSAEDELFGEERLVSALNDAPSANPGDTLPFVRRRIAEFVKEAPQFDDITMLGLRYKG